jgi:hypothetical protein
MWAMPNALNEPWAPPEPEETSTEELIVVDPRVVVDHAIGQLPCPRNPPPPDGWRYWKPQEKVPAVLGKLAAKIRDDAKRYPMGAFVQLRCDGEFVAARVEWHDVKGATGQKGCFRGVNLLRRRETKAGGLSA